MDKNPQQKEVTTTTIQDDEIDRVETSLSEKMKSMSPSEPYCWIYRVPEHMKKGNEQCYRPLSTSIGPVFYKSPELATMQELKSMVLKCFPKHHDDDDDDNVCRGYEPYIRYAREHQKKIRECYQRRIDLPSDEFIQMIVLDAVFLAYLLRSVGDCGVILPENNKFRVPYSCLAQDLFVEENQLPFFVIKDVYDIVFDGVVDSSCALFMDHAVNFIGHFSNGFPTDKAIKRIKEGRKRIDASKISHLLHLRMCCCLEGEQPQPLLEVTESRHDLPKMWCCIPLYEPCNNPEENRHYSHEFYNVKQLTAAGVKFMVNDQIDNLFDIKFDEKSGALKIPKLTLEDCTESVFRSILFFEQSHDYDKRYFTDYFIFLDDLIDDVEDIRILQQNKILHNDLGSDKEAAILINKLNKYVTYDSSRFVFSKVHKELKDYASTPWNQWKTILRNKYFNHPWSIISVVAAIILFILTLLQTITGFLQLQHPK